MLARLKADTSFGAATFTARRYGCGARPRGPADSRTARASADAWNRDDVAEGLLERARAPRRTRGADIEMPDGAEEAPACVEDRRGEAAEVAVELLALDRDAACGGRSRSSARSASGSVIVFGVKRRRPALQVALDGLGRAQREHDLAERERVRVVADLGAHARAASACPAGRARARSRSSPSRRTPQVGALVRAREQVVDDAGEVVARASRLARRPSSRNARRELVDAAGAAHGDALVAQAGQQVVGGRDALAERRRPPRRRGRRRARARAAR